VNKGKWGYSYDRYDAEIDTSTTTGYGSTGTVAYTPTLSTTQFTVDVGANEGDLYFNVDLYP
jgi:hypothetical protein